MILFLFNVGGYYIVFWGLRSHSDGVLQSRIESNSVTDEETVFLKIPFSLPYPVADDYQFVKGKFEHNGNFFRLIKQKLEGDTLYVVCVKDTSAKSINAKMVEYGNVSNDLPSQSKDSQNLLSKLIKEYSSDKGLGMTQLHSGWASKISQTHTISSFEQIYRCIQSPPPKVF